MPKLNRAGSTDVHNHRKLDINEQDLPRKAGRVQGTPGQGVQEEAKGIARPQKEQETHPQRKQP